MVPGTAQLVLWLCQKGISLVLLGIEFFGVESDVLEMEKLRDD